MIGVLTWLSSLDTNRVISFSTESESTTFQKLSWEFSRPLEAEQRSRLGELVTIEPEIAGEFKFLGARVEFVPDLPLPYGQNYTISLSSELRDVYANGLAGESNFEFSTPRPALLAQNIEQNQILMVEVIENSSAPIEVLVDSADPIREYRPDYYRQGFAYTTQPTPAGPSELWWYDWESADAERVELEKELVMSNLRFDRDGRLWFIGLIPSTELARRQEQGEFLSEVGEQETFADVRQVYRYNFGSGELRVVEQVQEQAGQLFEFDILGDSVFIGLGFDYRAWALDTRSTEDTLNYFGEFSQVPALSAGNQVIAGIDISSKADRSRTPQLNVLVDGESSFTPRAGEFNEFVDIAAGGDSVVFTVRREPLQFALGRFSLERLVGEEREVREVIADSESVSFALPQLSPAAEFLAVERYTVADLNDNQRTVRDFFNSGLPESADIIVYNYSNSNVKVSEPIVIPGAVNAIWVP